MVVTVTNLGVPLLMLIPILTVMELIISGWTRKHLYWSALILSLVCFGTIGLAWLFFQWGLIPTVPDGMQNVSGFIN